MTTYQFHPDLNIGGVPNEQRAGWAAASLKTFTELTGLSEGDGFATAVSDLLADLMHLAGAHGYEPCAFLSDTCERATGHFRAESIAADHEGDEPLEDPPQLLYPQEGAEDEN